MPPSPEDPNQRDTPTDMVLAERQEGGADLALAEKSGVIAQMREKFSQAIGRLDDAVYQPILRRLQQFQKREQAAEVGTVRRGFQKVFNSEAYQLVDKWILTFFAIFGPVALTYLASKSGTHIDENTKEAFFDYMSVGLTTGFAIDTVGNTVAKGSKYYFSVDPKLEIDGVDREKRELNWETAPIINGLAIAGGVAQMNGGAVRLARLVRLGRLAKISRISNIRGVTNSLEDEGVEISAKDRSKSLLKTIGGTAIMSSGGALDYTQTDDVLRYLVGAGMIFQTVFRDNFRSRAVLATVYTKRLEAFDRRIMEAFGNDPHLRHFGKLYKMGGNELDKIEDRFFNIFRIAHELMNPTGEETEVDEKGETVTKFVNRAVMFTDVRGFTALSHHHEPEEIEPVMAEYFSDMYPIVNENGGRFANLMGDGAALFFKDRTDEETGEVIPAAESAVRCAIALQDHSKKYDKILQEELPIPGKEVSHITGIGINSGRISVGDPFRKRKGKKGLRRPEILGDVVNTASRVESKNKEFPGHIVLITEDEYRAYPEHLQAMFNYCGESHMKGIGDVRIWGLPEDQRVNYAYDIDSFITVLDEEDKG